MLQSRFDLTAINVFIVSTVEVLKTMAQIEAKKGTPFIREKDQISGDISAVISIVSENRSGSMAISFSSACYLDIISKMLGEECKEINSENADAAAELCNQIFGMTKKKLNEIGYKIQPAIPSVICGPNHTIKHMKVGPCVAVKFHTAKGDFTIEAILSDLQKK